MSDTQIYVEVPDFEIDGDEQIMLLCCSGRKCPIWPKSA